MHAVLRLCMQNEPEACKISGRLGKEGVHINMEERWGLGGGGRCKYKVTRGAEGGVLKGREGWLWRVPRHPTAKKTTLVG